MTKEPIRFNSAEKKYIKEQNDIYLETIKVELGNLRGGISKDVENIVKPMNDSYFVLVDNLNNIVKKIDKRVSRHERWLWLLTIIAIISIIAIMIAFI